MTSFTPPPRALKRAKLDNLALLPASLLPYKDAWQQLANDQPPGTTLVVMPKAPGKPGQTLGMVATQLQARGHLVKVVLATRFVPTL
jgi:hypothetical protein